jgi:hypothetical protein
MPLRRAVPAVLALLFLAACRTGRNYTAPDVPRFADQQGDVRRSSDHKPVWTRAVIDTMMFR